MPKAGSFYICWLVILIDSVLREDEKLFFHKWFWNDVSTLKKNMIRYITDDLPFYSDDPDDYVCKI